MSEFKFCPYCGADIMPDAAFCSNCGASMPTRKSVFVPAADSVLPDTSTASADKADSSSSDSSSEDILLDTSYATVNEEPPFHAGSTPAAPAKKKNFGIIAAALVLVAVLFLALRGGNDKDGGSISERGLTGNDKIVYDLVLESSYDFKSPSSVRVISGDIVYDKDNDKYSGWFVLSAQNGFGGTTTGYYDLLYIDGNLVAIDIEDYSEEVGIDMSWAIEKCKEQDNFDADKVNAALAKKWESFY